jgi:hypothetical protein
LTRLDSLPIFLPTGTELSQTETVIFQKLVGKLAVITGGNSGLGLETEGRSPLRIT